MSSRRNFWGSAIGQLSAFIDEAAGTPQLAASSLPSMDDDVLEMLIPSIVENINIVGDDDVITARIDSNNVVRLFERGESSLFIFNQINGENTIGEIAVAYGLAFPTDHRDATTAVRDLFLELVHKGICIPTNSIDRLT